MRLERFRPRVPALSSGPAARAARQARLRREEALELPLFQNSCRLLLRKVPPGGSGRESTNDLEELVGLGLAGADQFAQPADSRQGRGGRRLFLQVKAFGDRRIRELLVGGHERGN